MPAAERAACWCVVPAAGQGARMGASVPKQYLEIAGHSVLLHTLMRLARHPRIAGLVVALARDDARWPGLEHLEGKPVRTAVGGD